jgi:hypothetical protein
MNLDYQTWLNLYNITRRHPGQFEGAYLRVLWETGVRATEAAYRSDAQYDKRPQ